jgi:hypothetical protein
MAHRYITTNEDGTIAITSINGIVGSKMVKTLFEISRTTDMATHFDPAVHTLAAIAAGIEGHRAMALTGECEDTDLPTDRYFRNAWEWTEDAVRVNMTKARAIHMDSIRAIRDKNLASLDLPFMRAVENGDQAAQKRIATQKQALRDIPQNFDLKTSPNTPDALLRKWPAILPRPVPTL